MLGALSTGHEIGLAVVGGLFIAFALAASFLAPRRWPDFPGKTGMSVFIIACLAFFAAMISSVAVFGAESEASAAEAGAGQVGKPVAKTFDISETEFKIGLPPLKKLAEGRYTFVVKNNGKIDHDLAIEGAKVTGPTKTPLIKPGGTAKITVSLAVGTYTLYCSVPGHREAGMVAKLNVG